MTPPEPGGLVEQQQRHDRETYNLRRDLSDVRRRLIDADKALRDARLAWTLCREGGQMLVIIVSRYRRAIRSLGWTPPDDENALIEKIRKDLEQ